LQPMRDSNPLSLIESQGAYP